MKRTRKRHRDPELADVCDFEVIGQLKANPTHLLLRGDDGRFYAMDPATSQLQPLEPDDSWAIDLLPDTPRRLELPRDIVA